MIIWVSGTPGVGKTVVGKALAKKLGYQFIDLPEFVKRMRLYESYDRRRDTWTIDPRRVRKALRKENLENCVLSSHIVVPGLGRSEKCIVLRLNPLVLWRRLERRGYSRQKIRENVEAEFVGAVLSDAVTTLGTRKVFQINTTEKNREQIVALCLRIVRGESKGDSVDWLTDLTERQTSRLLRSFAQAMAGKI
ncbi:MAG: adenylate kinase family protein [Candidatus Caldarchaeum sp.]